MPLAKRITCHAYHIPEKQIRISPWLNLSPNKSLHSWLCVEGLLPSQLHQTLLVMRRVGSNTGEEVRLGRAWIPPHGFLSSSPWNRLEAANPPGTCLSTISLESEHHQSCRTKLGSISCNSREFPNACMT